MKRISWLAMLPLLLLTLSACSVPARQAPPSAQIADLTAENERLQQEYDQLRARVEELDEALLTTGFLEPQVLVETATFSQTGETLQQVLNRGVLRCGVNANAPGMGYLDTDSGEVQGFDIDFCRAIAAAVFGNGGSALTGLIATTNRTRFPAIQSGDVDVLIRNATWTLERDGSFALDFAGPTLYDGAAVLVGRESGINTPAELADRSICVVAESTTVGTVAEFYAFIGETVDLDDYIDLDIARAAYERGDCAGLAADRTVLAGQRLLLAEPEEHVVLEEVISREPLAPVVRHGDSNWLNIVNWVVQCTLNAEYLGVSQRNVSRMRNADDVRIQRLLGETGELGEGLGLENDFCYQVVAQVGNYDEIYNRNLGPSTPYGLPRGLNELFDEGGLHYPLPFR